MLVVLQNVKEPFVHAGSDNDLIEKSIKEEMLRVNDNIKVCNISETMNKFANNQNARSPFLPRAQSASWPRCAPSIHPVVSV